MSPAPAIDLGPPVSGANIDDPLNQRNKAPAAKSAPQTKQAAVAPLSAQEEARRQAAWANYYHNQAKYWQQQAGAANQGVAFYQQQAAAQYQQMQQMMQQMAMMQQQFQQAVFQARQNVSASHGPWGPAPQPGATVQRQQFTAEQERALSRPMPTGPAPTPAQQAKTRPEVALAGPKQAAEAAAPAEPITRGKAWLLAGRVALGAVGGAVLFGGIGFLVGGPVGAGIGAAVGLGLGTAYVAKKKGFTTEHLKALITIQTVSKAALCSSSAINF
jgi:hypothetical protein